MATVCGRAAEDLPGVQPVQHDSAGLPAGGAGKHISMVHVISCASLTVSAAARSGQPGFTSCQRRCACVCVCVCVCVCIEMDVLVWMRL